MRELTINELQMVNGGSAQKCSDAQVATDIGTMAVGLLIIVGSDGLGVAAGAGLALTGANRLNTCSR
jgi:hypothetical protein